MCEHGVVCLPSRQHDYYVYTSVECVRRGMLAQAELYISSI